MDTKQVQIHLRLPPALHEQVKAAAEKQDVSLNQMIVLLVAGGVGFKLERKSDPEVREHARGPRPLNGGTDHEQPGET